MKEKKTLKIAAQHIHTESGLWCDSCLLPSVVREDFVLFGKRTLIPVSKARCRDCGNSDDRTSDG